MLYEVITNGVRAAALTPLCERLRSVATGYCNLDIAGVGVDHGFAAGRRIAVRIEVAAEQAGRGRSTLAGVEFDRERNNFV